MQILISADKQKHKREAARLIMEWLNKHGYDVAVCEGTHPVGHMLHARAKTEVFLTITK